MAAKLICLGLFLLAGCANDEEKNPIRTENAPDQLECVAAYYGGEPTMVGGEWALVFQNGTVVPWDDGHDWTFDELRADPDRIDIRDMLATPYPTGMIGRPTAADGDPGYFVPPKLLAAAYGASPQMVKGHLVNVRWLGERKVREALPTDVRLTMHEAAAPDAHDLAADMAEMVVDAYERYPRGPAWFAPYVTGDECCRTYDEGGDLPAIVGAPEEHAYGVAIDINPRYADNWTDQVLMDEVHWQNRVPQLVVDTFEEHGFAWGGRAYHYRTGHFVWRPELFDANCQL